MDSMVVGVGIKTRYLLKAVEVGYRRGSVATPDAKLVARARSFSRNSSARSIGRYIQGMPGGKHMNKMYHKTVRKQSTAARLPRIRFRRRTYKRLRRAERGRIIVLDFTSRSQAIVANER